VTPDEMMTAATKLYSVSSVNDEGKVGSGDAWKLAAELCARLDALVAAGERVAKAMEARPFKFEFEQHEVTLPCQHQWITGSTLGTRCGLCGRLKP
jgi:hypothetical protein